MDYQQLKFWFDILQTLVIAAIGIQQWLYRRQSATISGINRIEANSNEKINDLQTRVTRVEENVKHSPTHDDLGKIYEELKRTNNTFNKNLTEILGSVKRLEGEFASFSKTASNQLSILHQNELSKGNGK